MPAVLVGLAFIAGFIESPHFLDLPYLLSASSLYVETGLLVLGMTLVMICGQIDLSVASSLALVACVLAKLMASGLPPLIAIGVGLILGGLLGAINGVFVAKLRLPSFVVTLGTMAAYRGLAQVLMGPQSVRFPAALCGANYWKLPGTPLPIPLTCFILFAILMGLLLQKTVLGRWIFAVGANPRASLFSGLPVDLTIITAFALTGVLAAIGAILLDSRLTVARFDHAKGLEVDVITAVVLGGTRISGGSGSILGSTLALLLIALIKIGMGLANITAEYQLAVVGTLLVVAVGAGNFVRRFEKKNS